MIFFRAGVNVNIDINFRPMDISILGCGWLGLPLAETLIDDGHSVKGSTTREEKLEKLSAKKIEPYLLKLDPDLDCRDSETFWQSELLVLNIPPGRGRDRIMDYHTRQIRTVIEQVQDSPVSRVIFVSSTSVYPEKPGMVKEGDAIPGEATRDSGNALLQAEQLLISAETFSTVVLRFGGLYGYDRHPARYLAGRKGLGKGRAPVNLIHRDDCIGIIREVIERDIADTIYNCVSDGHPPRNIYYRAAAEKMGLEPPEFSDPEQDEVKDDSGGEQNYKIVSNQKLKDDLGYTFSYPNPMNLDGFHG